MDKHFEEPLEAEKATDEQLRAIWVRENSDELAKIVNDFHDRLTALAHRVHGFNAAQGFDEFMSALWAMRGHTRRFQSSVAGLTCAAAEAETKRADEAYRRAGMLRLAGEKYRIR